MLPLCTSRLLAPPRSLHYAIHPTRVDCLLPGPSQVSRDEVGEMLLGAGLSLELQVGRVAGAGTVRGGAVVRAGSGAWAHSLEAR